MAVDRRERDQYRKVQYKYATAAYSITTLDKVILADTTDGAFTLTLPPVAEAVGMLFSIRKTDSAANRVTLADRSDAIGTAATDLVIDAQDDRCLLYSDGFTWYVVSSVIA